jgi:hypothetical protein
MFVALLVLLLVAWAVHLLRSGPLTRERGGLLLLLYVLVGYCGIPMLLVAGVTLIHPHEMAHMLGVEPDHPFALFLGWAYLGMATVASLALRFRGSYLVAPAVLWAVFFAGATFVHVGQDVAVPATGHLGLLQIFAAHGLISVLLVVGLWASRAWRVR